MAGISSMASGALNNDFKFNGKELNEDLDLDWYEYGFRNNFDPQLGRFHSIDPLASEYPYYTPYQFAGNQPTIAVDIDGLEPAFINDLMQWGATKVASNPNSNTSKAIGAFVGVGKSIEKTITGAVNTIAHPIETGKALLNMNTPEGIANMAIGVAGKVNTLQNGTGFEKAAVISEAVTDVATVVVGTKGLVVGVKGAGAAGEVAGAVETVSPNVQRVLNTLNEIKSEGGTVKVNPLAPTQEINMTIQQGTQKLDFRIETHPLPSKYGGNGTSPQRHMNVDLHPNKKVLPNSGHKILE
jgi:RHS repeat-associated protein